MKKIIFLLLFVITSTFSRGQNADAILIAAASDLKFALDSVVTVFRKGKSRGAYRGHVRFVR